VAPLYRKSLLVSVVLLETWPRDERIINLLNASITRRQAPEKKGNHRHFKGKKERNQSKFWIIRRKYWNNQNFIR